MVKYRCVLGGLLIAGCVGAAVIVGATSNTRAEDATGDTITGIVDVSCTIEGTGASSYNVTASSGIVSSEVGATNFNVTCNDADGFALYAIGYSKNTDGNTNLINNNDESYSIRTGTNTTGESSWAMKVTPESGTTSVNNFDNYHAAPGNYTRVIERVSGTTPGVIAAAKSTYQVYVSGAQAAGTYTGQIKYTLVHPSMQQCPEGYKFDGGICKKDPCYDIEYMQNITYEDIKNMPTGTQCQLKDNRDDKPYWIAKLEDGNVWMTQNLDLDLSTSEILTPSNTDIATNYTPAVSTSGSTFDSSDATGENSYDGGDYYWKGDWISNTSSTAGYSAFSNAFSTDINDAGDAAEHYHVGNLYQWSAATARTGNGLSGGAEATGSICPKGWRLPDASADSSTDYSYQKLFTAYGVTSSAASTASPLFFMPAGYISSGKLGGAGYHGYSTSVRSYSDTSTNKTNNYYFSSSSFYPFGSAMRYVGVSVRCVARNQHSYILEYDLNGGSSTTPILPQIISSEYSNKFTTTLSSTEPTPPTGHEFTGWCSKTPTASGCDGDFYQPGDNVTISGLSSNKVTLYATYSSNTYTISLDNQSATTAGTGTIYETYGTKYSLTSDGDAMTTSANPITKPTRSYTYTVSYDANSQGASYTGSPTSATRTDTFKGYYTATSGGTQYIDDNGYLMSSASNTNFSANGTLYAQWTDGDATFTLPAITKTGHTCKWAEGSASGTQYAGGESRTISANTTYYAVCTTNKHTVTISVNQSDYGSTSESSVSDVPYSSTISVDDNKITINGTEITASPSAATSDWIYSFVNWTNDCGSTMPDSDCTITANFKRESACTGVTVSGVCYDKMQDFSDDTYDIITGAMTMGGQYRFKDIRDNKLYSVSKLKDGNVWMTQNLALGDSSGITLHNTDSDITADTYIISSAYDAAGASWNNSNLTPVFAYYTSSSDKNEYGNYYNWTAATAAGGVSGSGDSPTSICPKGWKLPSYSPENDISTLYTAYGSNYANFATAFNIGYAGFMYTSGVTVKGTHFYIWSDRSADSSNAYKMYAANGVMSSDGGTASKGMGMSIRCVVRKPKGLKGISTMQEMTPEVIADTAEGDTKQLEDTRDDKLYWVTKLKDGNIWMTQNLDYDLSVTANKSLKSATSDVSSDTTLAITSSWGTSTTALYYKAGAEQYLPNGSDTATNITCTAANNGGENCHYHLGDYYSWNAATANTHSDTTQYSNASGSICPKGWKLPMGYNGTNGDFKSLNTAYGVTNSSAGETILRAAPLHFARSGGITSSGLINVGSGGYYWSSTVSSSNAAHGSSLNVSGTVNPTVSTNRYHGYAVRCVARNTFYMQDIATWKDTKLANVGDSVTAVDKRDGKEYLVSKLGDGKIWMLDNLRLGGNSAITLTNADTNITASSWTLPASSTSYFSSSTGYTNPGIYAANSETIATTRYGAGSGKMGVYYNYCAATGGTYCASSKTSNATEDICPKGWRMPTGNNGATGEYYYLYNTVYSGNATNFKTGLSTPVGGYINGTSVTGSKSYFWTSTYYNSNTNMSALYITPSAATPATDMIRYRGVSMRCVAK